MAVLPSVSATLPPHPTKPLWKRIRQHGWAYLFLLPMLILSLMFVVYPIIGSIRYAFYNWTGVGEPTEFVGWRHFITVASDKYFWNAFRNTILYTAVLVPIQLTLALVLALILNSPRLRFSTFYRTIYFLPVVTSMAVVGVVFSLLFARLGTNYPTWLVETGLVNPRLGLLQNPKLVMWVIIGIGIWHTLGLNLVNFLAGLQTIPNELYEAATIDGAGWFAKFWYITVPLIRPVGLIVLMFALLGSLGVFDPVWVMTQGGPFFASDVVSTYVYSYTFGSTRGDSSANFGYASAAALFMSLLVLGLTLLQVLVVGWSRRRQSEHRM
jgi:ABC-type sugar transport system permease subunit